MSRDILQRFLGRKLFDVGPDDERLGRLRKAASDLRARLLGSPPLAIRYALVAFDPNVPVTEPTLEEVGTAVENHWNTYASCFADTPRTAFRSVLLAALEQAVAESVGIASAVALLSRNLLPHLDLGAERDVWSDLITVAESSLEDRALAEWAVGDDRGPNDQIRLEIGGDSGMSAPRADKAALAQAFFAASGPQNAQNQALSNANPNWPNSGQSWSYEFAPRAAQAVAEAIDKAIAAALRPLAELKEAIAENLERGLGDALPAMLQPARGLRRRNDLLWWKEALYSPSARVGYRTLPAVGTAVLMAVDLRNQVPPFCPPSVEYFLREAVAAATGADNSPSGAKPLKKFVSELASSGPPEPVRAALAAFRQTSGRGPLVALLADLFEDGRVSPERFVSGVGISGDLKLTLGDLAVWIFRELQAAAAVAAEPPAEPAAVADEPAAEEDAE